MNKTILIIQNRGKLEIDNCYITCFLGKNDEYIASENLYKKLNAIRPTREKEMYNISGEKYLIYYPIPGNKKISIVTNEGKRYKSQIYFIDDIKNIIKGLNMDNPCFCEEGKYQTFGKDIDYGFFLYHTDINEIKDIGKENVSLIDLKKLFDSIQIKDTLLLEDINKNIKLYSKMDTIGKEKYFLTLQRNSLTFLLDRFYDNKQRNTVEDVIYGIFGNYASGKSFFLIYYNYKSEFPSVYLNLKILKSLFRTSKFPELLNNELMFLFYKLKKNSDDFTKFISNFLPYNNYTFNNLILSIITKIKNENILIILDQYQEKIINDKYFIKNLKKILFYNNSKIKVIISSSMNDGPIKKAYLDIILGNYNSINKELEITEIEKENEKNKNEEAKNQKIKNEEVKNGKNKNEEVKNDKNKNEEVKDEKNKNEEIKNEKNKNEGNEGNIIEEKKSEENKNDENIIEENIIEEIKIEENNNEENKKKMIEINEEEIEKKEMTDGENLKYDNKTNNFIPFHFMKKLVDDLEIKEDIKEIQKENNENFNKYLKLFNYLPLYYNLCRINENDLQNFTENTKSKIRGKIKQINNDEKFNLIYFDRIRKMIDNEITVNELNSYYAYIPFKYFYIEKDNTKLILRTHFPLVKDVWNNIIMDELVEFFDGEIKFGGNVVGSLMELNFFVNIKNKIISLDIDGFIKFESISGFEKIVESDIKEFKNKNIFISQKNQNGPFFDFAYLEGKNLISPKLTFVQVKKSFSDNAINKQKMYNIFEKSKKNFFDTFNFIPDSDKINLIYITLFNNEIKQAIIAHDNCKETKKNKIYELGKNVNSIVYSVNRIYNFCDLNNIKLFFYEPKEHLFYIKNKGTFELAKLSFSFENQNEFNLDFNTDVLLAEFKKNKSNCQSINSEYEKYKKEFLNNKRIMPFSYKINKFDMKNVFDFANRYFQNANLINYIDLSEVHIDCNYNNLTSRQAIICFKLKGNKKDFKVDSIIYNNKLIKYTNDTFKLIGPPKLDRNNDFLAVVGFDSINESFKIFIN